MIDLMTNDSEALNLAFLEKPVKKPPPPPLPPPVHNRRPGLDARIYFYWRNVLTMMMVKGVLRVVGHLAAAAGRWSIDQLWRGYQLAKWRVSRRVSVAVFKARQEACDRCEALVKVWSKRYCGACNCPHWRYSELTMKNQRQGHNCPMGLHNGSYRTTSGCPGCGGGNKNGQHKAPEAQEKDDGC